MKAEYLISAISSNFDLLEILSLATFAYILSRKEESGTKRLFIYALIFARYLLPVALKYVKENDLIHAGKQEE